MDYWRDCIADAFESVGLSATDEQIDEVTAWVEGAHENYGMATGQDVATSNLRAAQERESEDAIRRLEAEKDREREAVEERLKQSRQERSTLEWKLYEARRELEDARRST